MNILLLLVIIAIYLYLVSCDRIEGFKINNNFRFKDSDKMFIPYAPKNMKLASDFYMLPRKSYKKTGGLLDSLIRMDLNYYDYLYDFPLDDPNITDANKPDSYKSYLSHFQDIVLHNESDELYKDNKKLDKHMVYNPLSSDYYIDMEFDIIPIDSNIKKFKNTCEYVKCPYGKKIINSKRNSRIFNIESKETERFCCGNL